jgi:ABC-type polysaccharide/polyol phosphate transport system ATPase subunit
MIMEKDLAIKVENACPVDYAIKVNGVSKTFRIPHEKISTLKGAFVSALKSHGYEEFNALDDVSFEVKKGEFFGIIGRNGSGKSTLLKILAGIYQADKGEIKVNGRISPFLELGIGFNPELSGRDNIYLNAAVLGLTHKQINEKFDDIVDFSELRRFIDQKVKNYSSGMQVRLMFSVAVHANRDILLMDEVLAVGDSNFQQKCIMEFTKYKHLGKTVVLVTHDILTVQKYCDRVMLLRNGKIKMIGTAEEVGNEYIRQNMSDEEKRIVDETKSQMDKAEKDVQKNKKEENKKEKKEGERWGNQDVILKKIEVLDSNKKRRNVFNSFDNMTVRLYYKRKNRDIKTAVFGIEIFNDRNYRLFGFNTSMVKKAINIENDEGYLDFELTEIPFSNGSYTITPAIANETCGIQYDFWNRAIGFAVTNVNFDNFVFGDVNIKLRINDEKGSKLAGGGEEIS